MAAVPLPSPDPLANAGSSGALPEVRLEMRHGHNRTTFLDFPEVSFLVGSVPGCDLRLPGAALPPLLCMLSRHSAGVVLRKLALTQPILVNGKAALTNTPLNSGDRVTVGAVDLLVHIKSVALRLCTPETDDLSHRQQELEERARELENDRALWYRRREEMEQENRQFKLHQEDLTSQREEIRQREEALEQQAQLLRVQQSRQGPLDQQKQELDGQREEMLTLRQQLYDRYRERRDRLAALQQAITLAARKVQHAKRANETEGIRLAERRQQLDLRADEMEKEALQIEKDRKALDEERAGLQLWHKEQEQLVNGRHADCDARDRQLAIERDALQKGQAQYQADLVRIDRLSASVDDRQKLLEQRQREIDERKDLLKSDLAELEDQAGQLDQWHVKLADDAERLAEERTKLEPNRQEMLHRTAALEGQQAMLTTLRGRLEKMRDEVHRESQLLSEQRERQETTEIELSEKLAEMTRLRTDLDNERQLHDQERRRFEERSSVMESAVTRIRQSEASLSQQQTDLQERLTEVEKRGNEQAEQGALLETRFDQLTELQKRLEADRQALRERESALARVEQARESLQEQLRRRSDELAARNQALTERERKQDEAAAAIHRQLQEIEAARVDLLRQQHEQMEGLAARHRDIDSRHVEISERADHFGELQRKLQEMGRQVAQERKALSEERSQADAERKLALEELDRSRGALNDVRQELVDLGRQLPELELRAGEAIARVGQARDRLKEHLAELHTYAKQGHDDLESLRQQLQVRADEVRQQGLELHRGKDEHRLAVAHFRQQIIDWQGQVSELKRALAEGETRLERRQAEVAEQARAIDATTARLAQQAQELDEQQKQVLERRAEMEGHLNDMREWYRRKLREMANGDPNALRKSEIPGTEPTPSRDILSLTGELSPGDKHLGELMRSLELVDAPTLTAILVEARRQRRTLRQVLLAGGYLTLYQLALIEAGNLDGLVLGPTRIVDRLRVTPREIVYRVFDPRRGKEVVLRHLTEAEAQDAVHPDEFQQRFAAAANVQHPHLPATLEVLEIAGRPAVLQEYLTAVPSTDWPPLVAVPGVWFRLLSQAALGMATVHRSGLVHGHLIGSLVALTADGVVKISGLGEPAWLLDAQLQPEELTDDPAADLAALGKIAAEWIARGRTGSGKNKALPESLSKILDRLTGKAEAYASAQSLLDELDAAGSQVPPNAEAWDRLLRDIREALATNPSLRQAS